MLCVCVCERSIVETYVQHSARARASEVRRSQNHLRLHQRTDFKEAIALHDKATICSLIHKGTCYVKICDFAGFLLDAGRRLQHVANMGNSGRYEIYMGQNELGNGDAQEMRQRIILRLSKQPGIEIVGERMSGPLNPQLGDGRDGGSATNVANVEQCSAQLIDMGFAATAVERALLLTGLSFERALDLLLAEQASGEEQKDGEGEQGAVLQSALERPERPELFEEPVPGDLD